MHVFRQVFFKRRSFGSLDACLSCHDGADLRGCYPVKFIEKYVSLKEVKGNENGKGGE